MKPPRNNSAFTLIELLVVISIIGILITIAVPNISTALTRAKMTETLANARSLQQATQMMSLDSSSSGDGMIWTTKIPAGGGAPAPVGLGEFLTAITTDGYMTASDLRKVLSAPGRTPTTGAYGADTIAFNIYEVSENSPADQVFVTTANITPPGGMIANATPYGNKGFVFFTKGGGGGIRTRATDATSTNNFPTSTGTGDTTVTYNYNPIK
jgi:prepilin-type N-terminal cleavage/methylation domain-containing protein